MTNEVVEDCPPSCTGVSCVCCLRQRKGGHVEVHNFVPFNSYSTQEYSSTCWLCFNPGIEEGFLDLEEIVPRSKKPGFWTKAKYVLPTGCIQEVHVRNGESALKAFRRWNAHTDEAAQSAFDSFVSSPTRQHWNEYCKAAYLSGFDATICGRLT